MQRRGVRKQKTRNSTILVIAGICAVILVVVIFFASSNRRPIDSVASSAGKEWPEGKAASQNENANFRNSSWGMSRDQVIASEAGRSFENTNGILITSVDGVAGRFEASALYYFDNVDCLYKAAYLMHLKHANPNQFIDDFIELKDIYTEKYGAPTTDLEHWDDSFYKNDPSNYGMAIATGALIYLCEWGSSNTVISLMLSGDNYECSVVITYKDVDSNYEPPNQNGV